MGRRIQTFSRAVRTGWGVLAGLILLLALVFALFAIAIGLRDSDQAQKCRSAAAAHLDAATVVRDDALADSQETVLRLFDASFKRDQDAIAIEGTKLPALYARIHEATAAIRVANEERIASVDACTKG